MSSNTTNDPYARLQRALSIEVKPDADGIVTALCDAMLDAAKDRPEMQIKALGDKTVLQVLRAMIALTYTKDNGTSDETRNKLMVDIANQSSPEARHAIMDMMGRVAHLHQLGSLTARELLLERHPHESPAEKFLYAGTSKLNFPSVRDALNALGRPVMEFTFTAHPTNTNSVASMRAQRELVQAITAWRKAPDETTREELAYRMKRYVEIPMLPERDGVTGPLKVAEETDYMLYFMHNLYDGLDDIYRDYDTSFAQAYAGRYNPADLKLNIRAHSWGSSGDKDGNNNVNADTTLHAVAEHRYAIVNRYRSELAEILKNSQGSDDVLHAWDAKLEIAQKALAGSINELNDTVRSKSKKFLSEADFERIRTEVAKASESLDAKAFITDLETVQDQSPTRLSLLRKVRHFGFALGNIEYRETAEEYSRVVELLVPGYKEMGEEARVSALTSLIQHPETLKEAVAKMRATFDTNPAQPYSKQDARPIAYQTLKRMELARDFPDMIQNNVLAECQETSNFLEALVLQHAVADGDKRPKLGIIPLFEEYNVLAKAPQIVQSALDNDAYKSHLESLSTMGDDREKQQVQLAHSDNARRAGSIGSRAAIYQAQDALQRMGIRRYQGGSQSDAYRDGQRAISAKNNEFGLHDFSKMTYQGGDLLNFFNLPQSTTRLITVNLSNNALALKKNNRSSMMTAEDRAVLPALLETIPRYEEVFQDERFSQFVAEAGYTEQQLAGNFSSRAAARDGAPAKVSVPNTRTISFSETLEHAGIVPIWIGARGMRDSLKTHLARGGELTPELLHEYYEKSPVFKDVVDRLLYSTARSSFTPLQRMKDHPLMQRMTEEYSEAYSVAMEAYTGKAADSFRLPAHPETPATTTSDQRKTVIQEVFPHVADFMSDQDRLMRSVHAMRALWLPSDSDKRYVPSALLHNMMDTVHHGTNWLIADPGAAKLHCTEFDIARPHANGVDKSGRSGR